MGQRGRANHFKMTWLESTIRLLTYPLDPWWYSANFPITGQHWSIHTIKPTTSTYHFLSSHGSNFFASHILPCWVFFPISCSSMLIFFCISRFPMLDFFAPHLLSGPGQNHTHIDTNYQDEDDGWKTFSVQSHCFKVKVYGSTISK
jgi:hypothetical protein